MKVLLVPFGSFKVGESHDEDFVVFPEDAPQALFPGSVLVEECYDWGLENLIYAAKAAGFHNPDIWTFNQEGAMKPIIVANLVKDYPLAAEYIQLTMRLQVNIQGGDAELLNALEENVRRWQDAPPHLLNIRKRVFSSVQQAAYVQGFGFVNTKSEVAGAAQKLFQLPGGSMRRFLMGNEIDPDEISMREIYGLGGVVVAYKSQHGCICELPDFSGMSPWRTYLTPMQEIEGKVFVLWEEVYTNSTRHGVVELEIEVWQMLLKLDLKEME